MNTNIEWMFAGWHPHLGEECNRNRCSVRQETIHGCQTLVKSRSEQFADTQQKIQELRELFADAPVIGKAAQGATFTIEFQE